MMVGVMVVMWWWYWMMWWCGGVMRVVVWCGVDVAVLWTLFRTRVGCWSYDYLFQIVRRILDKKTSNRFATMTATSLNFKA